MDLMCVPVTADLTESIVLKVFSPVTNMKVFQLLCVCLFLTPDPKVTSNLSVVRLATIK